jgi:hypothetical protein
LRFVSLLRKLLQGLVGRRSPGKIMAGMHDRVARSVSWRRVVRGILMGLASGVLVRSAAAEDQVLQALIQSQSGEFGQGFDSASRTVRMPKASLPTLSPSTAQTTEQAIGQYEAINARGGWPNVPPSQALRLGNRQPSVQALRQRLAATGDLEVNAGIGDIYDSYVEAGVRRFQARHGLAVDGVVREQTFNGLNVPAAVRLNQLKVNLVRLRSLSGNLGPRFVAQIEAIENGLGVSRHIGVVGKPDRPSPDIQIKISEINFNPFWTVPNSIVRRDLIPKMQEEPDYLSKNRIHIFDPRGSELQPQQVNWYSEEAVNFRRGLSLSLLRLRAGAECARTGELAARRYARLVALGYRSGDQIGRAQGREASASRATLLGLRHRVDDAGRDRAVS